MKLRGWIVVAAVATGAVVTMRGGCLASKPPDEVLGSRFEAICEIARTNVDKPVPGVLALGSYLGDHLGDMFGELGGTITMIEKIADDGDHDMRAHVARDNIFSPLTRCSREMNRFIDAVDRSPEASRLLNRTLDRVGRTLEIILSGNDLRELPARLERMFDARTTGR